MSISGERPEQPRGRGALSNPADRFAGARLEIDWDAFQKDVEPDERPLKTQYIQDDSQSIITYNDSPDIGFDAAVNPYRGCEHGCIYCYARPTHEYASLSAGQDFESVILVKMKAPELLRRELCAKKWKPQVIAMSGVTDCYQPVERQLKLTRGCLEVLAEARNPVGIVTKNRLVTRDKDLLAELARHKAATVLVSLTTLDPELRRIMEPRTSTPDARLEAIRELAGAGVPVGTLIAPVIPGLNDSEIPKLVEAAGKAGATFANYVTLRLPYGVKDLFEEWLTRHFPQRKDKVLNQIRSMRDGKLNSSDFGSRMRGEGILAEQIKQVFKVACRRAGMAPRQEPLSTASFRRPEKDQLSLF